MKPDRADLSKAMQHTIDLMIECELSYPEANLCFNQARIAFEVQRRAMEAGREQAQYYERRKK